jgi:hypothetical protein
MNQLDVSNGDELLKALGEMMDGKMGDHEHDGKDGSSFVDDLFFRLNQVASGWENNSDAGF